MQLVFLPAHVVQTRLSVDPGYHDSREMCRHFLSNQEAHLWIIEDRTEVMHRYHNILVCVGLPEVFYTKEGTRGWS